MLISFWWDEHPLSPAILMFPCPGFLWVVWSLRRRRICPVLRDWMASSALLSGPKNRCFVEQAGKEGNLLCISLFVSLSLRIYIGFMFIDMVYTQM